MSSWVMSIVGVVCLGVLLDLIVPEGQTNKYIKGVFALLIIFVIISPLPALVGKKFDLKLNSTSYTVNTQYLETIDNYKIENKIDTLECFISGSGYSSDVTVTKEKSGTVYTKKDAVSKISNIEIVLPKLVLNESDMNILITNIKTFTSRLFAVEENLVKITVG